MDEFCIEWTRGDTYAGVTAPSGTALKNRILKLKSQYPDDIPRLVENKDGSIYAVVPVNYIKVTHPRRLSESQREAASERFKKMHKERE